MVEPEHYVTGIAEATVMYCKPRRNMTCGSCYRMLWDCECMRSPECEHCELAPEDADYVNPIKCEESPDGRHNFVETAREP